MTKIVLPEGYRVEYGGQFESEAKASQTLLITSVLAILIIFLLLFQEFKNFKLAGIILLKSAFGFNWRRFFNLFHFRRFKYSCNYWIYNSIWHCYPKWNIIDFPLSASSRARQINL